MVGNKGSSAWGRDFQLSFFTLRCHHPGFPESDFFLPLASVNRLYRNNEPHSFSGYEGQRSILYSGILVDEKSSSLVKDQKLPTRERLQTSY